MGKNMAELPQRRQQSTGKVFKREEDFRAKAGGRAQGKRIPPAHLNDALHGARERTDSR